MYKSIIDDGDRYRKKYVEGLTSFVKRKNHEGYQNREAFMPPETFADNIELYRKQYIEMLGINQFESETHPEPEMSLIGEDADCQIYRVVVYISEEIPFNGLLMIPHGVAKAPLVIAQHGGGGTPELCSDMNGKNNYNRMVRRLLEKGMIVFAPQLLLWNYEEIVDTRPLHHIIYDRRGIDNELKRFGTSITALEIKGIMESITFLSGLDCVEEENIGMVGISYGGYFTLHTMAADVRIKAGYSNACFNDRNQYSWSDWCYKNSGNLFQDAEVAALCAPRKLYVAVGIEDVVFDYKTAIPEGKRVEKYYSAFSCADHFRFDVWQGGHTVISSDEGFEFMFSAFKKEKER